MSIPRVFELYYLKVILNSWHSSFKETVIRYVCVLRSFNCPSPPGTVIFDFVNYLYVVQNLQDMCSWFWFCKIFSSLISSQILRAVALYGQNFLVYFLASNSLLWLYRRVWHYHISKTRKLVCDNFLLEDVKQQLTYLFLIFRSTLE
jgi:hypothetical protein